MDFGLHEYGISYDDKRGRLSYHHGMDFIMTNEDIYPTGNCHMVAHASRLREIHGRSTVPD